MRTHGFVERRDYSYDPKDEPFWDAIYRKAFPGLMWHQPCPGDGAGQRLGIDRVIYFASGQMLRIDEKKRDGAYPDILLEYLSNDRTGASGWIEHELQIDYLAYAFMPTRQCYMLPWPLLRRAWLHFRAEWMRKAEARSCGFQIVSAQNSGYTTKSVAVPIDVLLKAISRASVIDLKVVTA